MSDSDATYFMLGLLQVWRLLLGGNGDDLDAPVRVTIVPLSVILISTSPNSPTGLMRQFRGIWTEKNIGPPALRGDRAITQATLSSARHHLDEVAPSTQRGRC